MKKVHFIGINGTGLSAIAAILLERNYIVSGSDRQITENAQRLSNAGATVYQGHSPEHVTDVDLVIRSSAIPDDNVEILTALEKNIPVLKRGQFLKEVVGGKKCIAVSGTHGKTTTTAMIAWMLTYSGLDPSYIIGSISTNLGTNAHEGTSDLFVIEADEYDYMFLGLQPDIAVVTGVEYDHPDCFSTPEDYYQAFFKFTDCIHPGGSLFLCANDSGAVRLFEERKTPKRILLYGITDSEQKGILNTGELELNFSAQELKINKYGCYSFNFIVRDSGLKIEIDLQVPGVHNVLNAVCALSIMEVLNISMLDAKKAIGEYKGTQRRFEIVGEREKVVYINDYAHHPTEIKATLSAARDCFPERRILSVWQPHTYSRTRLLLGEFSQAFTDSDMVLIMDIYPARETDPADGFDSQDILEYMLNTTKSQHQEVIHISGLYETAQYLTKQVQDGDVVLLLSAGDAYLVFDQIFNPVIERELERNIEELSSILGTKVQKNVPLAKYTAARIGGPADLLIQVQSVEELAEMAAELWGKNIPFFVLGAGSNILVSDRGFRGAIILNRAKKVEFQEKTDPPTVWAESGANWGVISRLAVQRGLAGFEWAVGIPGTVGGAVVGNAGAHGTEISDVLVVADILHLKNNNNQRIALKEKWPVQMFEYAYRSSVLKRDPGRYVILSAVFALERSEPDLVQEKVDQFTAYRRRTQPLGASMGSMFKNPAGDHAGRLIDAAGLKGACVGDAEISPKHANFFINRGEATADDVLSLIKMSKHKVYDRFGIELDLEIELIGEFEPELKKK